MSRRAEIPEFTEDDLKRTPNSAGDMRFGPRGQARPMAASLPPQELTEKKPVNLRRIRNRTEIFFGVIFAVIAALMIAGALSLLLPAKSTPTAPTEPASAEEAATDTPAEGDESRELQGGVKVRKGLSQ